MAIERRCIPLVEGPNSCHDILVGSRHTRCQNGRLVPAQNVRPPTNLVASFGGGGGDIFLKEGRLPPRDKVPSLFRVSTRNLWPLFPRTEMTSFSGDTGQVCQWLKLLFPASAPFFFSADLFWLLLFWNTLFCE